MTKGDAFNRGEVTSGSVTTDDRYVVSFIVGLSDGDAQSPQAAAEAATGVLRQGGFTVAVHDRVSGVMDEYYIASDSHVAESANRRA